MAWLKLTCVDDTKIILNLDKIIGICVEDNVIVVSEGSVHNHVKESLEEIEAMLNKNEQSQKLEITSNDLKRDYIGSDRPTTSRDFGKD